MIRYNAQNVDLNILPTIGDIITVVEARHLSSHERLEAKVLTVPAISPSHSGESSVLVDIDTFFDKNVNPSQKVHEYAELCRIKQS